MTSDIYAHILELIEMFFCEHFKKCWNYTQRSGAEILRKRTISTDLKFYVEEEAVLDTTPWESKLLRTPTY